MNQSRRDPELHRNTIQKGLKLHSVMNALFVQDFKAYQLEMEAHLQDKAFLTNCLKQLQDDGDDSLLPPGACTPRYLVQIV